MDKFKQLNLEAYNQAKKAAMLDAFMNFFVQWDLMMSMALIGYVGSIEVSEGRMKVGDITSFLLYMIQLIMNFFMLSGAAGNYFKLAGASKKIVSIMRELPPINTRGG